MAQPGPARPMPAVAGMQKQHLEAMATSAGPPVGTPAGPFGHANQITSPAAVRTGFGVPAVSAPTPCIGCVKSQLGSPSTWPLWAKILVPTLIVGGGIAVTVAVVRSRRMRFPDYGFDGIKVDEEYVDDDSNE